MVCKQEPAYTPYGQNYETNHEIITSTLTYVKKKSAAIATIKTTTTATTRTISTRTIAVEANSNKSHINKNRNKSSSRAA